MIPISHYIGVSTLYTTGYHAHAHENESIESCPRARLSNPCIFSEGISQTLSCDISTKIFNLALLLGYFLRPQKGCAQIVQCTRYISFKTTKATKGKCLVLWILQFQQHTSSKTETDHVPHYEL